jgi:hypothetical protein
MTKLVVFLGGASLVLLAACSQDDGGGSQPQPPGPVAQDYGPQPNVNIPTMPNHIQIHSAVSSDKVAALNESVSLIYAVNIDPTNSDTQNMMSMMHLSDVNPATLQNWLETRVHYVVGSDFDVQSNLSADPRQVQYPNPTAIPSMQVADINSMIKSLADDQSQAAGGAQVVMLNIGAAIYLFGKQNQQLVDLNLGSIGSIPFTSPRTGLLEIGPGMFPDLGGRTVQNILLDVFRAGTLFHEARHSDGNGITTGFLHAKCPAGSDYAGLAACDASLNGPYTVGANMHKALMMACGDSCTELTMTALRNIYNDVSDRVLDPASLPNAPVGAQAGTNWDDTPEGITGITN